MLKGLLAFAFLTFFIGMGIIALKESKPESRKDYLKAFGFGAICSAIALLVLSFIVIVF